MKKTNTPKELLKLNILVTILIIAANLLIFFGFDTAKDNFTNISAYANGFLFFLYLYLLNGLIKKDTNLLKKEAFYINYPISIAVFFTFLFIVLIISTISLINLNKDAANVTFVFTFFMSTIAMLFPSILLGVFMYFVVPAYIIPSLNINKNKKSESNILLLLFFVIFIIFCLYNGITSLIKVNSFESQNKYKSSKITINYSTDFLKLNEKINAYSKKKMAQDKMEIPFFYTTDSFPYSDYESAERFCRAMDARVPNYLEIYHIVFNKFDTFGDKYYWTSDRDGKHNLVLHFKNMSYEIERKPANVNPSIYCVATVNENRGFSNKNYFYRNVKKENKETIQSMAEKPFDFNSLANIIGTNKKDNKITEQPIEEELVNSEKKHVNFSVKAVSPEVLKELIQAGYTYNPTLSIKREYETNDTAFTNRIQNRATNNIRLCYYPFTEYGNLTLFQERQIWQQSFCSPAFDLVNQTPVYKTKHEKDAYCFANGGRLPNIPELMGILKTLGLNQTNVKYWTNNKITDTSSNSSIPILLYYQDSRFVNVKAVNNYENDSAYTFCIKKPQIPSKVIANYKSRFANVEGSYYAKEKCASCHYYEVPDVILQQ